MPLADLLRSRLLKPNYILKCRPCDLRGVQ